MKIKKLLMQYKSIAREMKSEARNYNNLAIAVRSRYCSDKTFENYRASWKRLLALNDEAYRVMCEYRRLAGSVLYRALFLLGVMPRQNSFRFIDGSETQFSYNQMINLLNLK